MKINKLNAGLVVVSMLGTISVFAMDNMTSTSSMMMKTDTMMVTGTTTTVSGTSMMNEQMMLSDDQAMMINKKSSKADVAKLQEFLISKGYLKLIKGTKLGFYGPATMNAYKKFEKMSMKNMSDKKMMKDGKMMSTTSMMKATDTMMTK